MSALATLKLTAAQKSTHMTPAQQRRTKLVRRLDEQIEMAAAQAAGTHYAAVKYRTVTDAATGAKRQVQTAKRVKAWHFVGDNGKLALCVRFGPRVLELAKGKWAVEVGTEKDLVSVLDVIKTAVLAGELDAQIESAVGKLRVGFKK